MNGVSIAGVKVANTPQCMTTRGTFGPPLNRTATTQGRDCGSMDPLARPTK